MSDGLHPQVALVAAASKEAAYLADFVFHHLRFGFRPIEIHVNRSQDATEEIARNLADGIPDVRVFNADHFDAAATPTANVQRSIYSEARGRLLREFGPDAYQMYLDIDEFWTPRDFRSSIASVLMRAGRPDIAAFNWFVQGNDTEPFMPPFFEPPTGVHGRQFKSGYLGKIPVKSFTVHGIEPAAPARLWIASGLNRAEDRPYSTCRPPEAFAEAFVLHRLYRSQLEYLAIMGKARPRSKGARFKTNRFGYHHLFGPDGLTEFPIAPGALRAYQRAREDFFAVHGLSAWEPAARKSVRARAKATLHAFRALDPAERDVLAPKFQNLDLERLEAELSED